jgi:hypothetical protein
MTMPFRTKTKQSLKAETWKAKIPFACTSLMWNSHIADQLFLLIELINSLSYHILLLITGLPTYSKMTLLVNDNK